MARLLDVLQLLTRPEAERSVFRKKTKTKPRFSGRAPLKRKVLCPCVLFTIAHDMSLLNMIPSKSSRQETQTKPASNRKGDSKSQ